MVTTFVRHFTLALFLLGRAGAVDIPLYLAYIGAYSGDWSGGSAMEPAVIMAFEYGYSRLRFCVLRINPQPEPPTRAYFLKYLAEPSDAFAHSLRSSPSLTSLAHSLRSRRDVNADPSTLPGFDLRRMTVNGGCAAAPAVKALFEMISNTSTPLVGVAGPGCSISSKAVTVTASIFNLATVSGSAGSSELSQKNLYPYYLRTVAPDIAWVPAAVDLFAVFGWTRVAVIGERSPVTGETAAAFADQVSKKGAVRVLVNERINSKVAYTHTYTSPRVCNYHASLVIRLDRSALATYSGSLDRSALVRRCTCTICPCLSLHAAHMTLFPCHTIHPPQQRYSRVEARRLKSRAPWTPSSRWMHGSSPFTASRR